MLMPAKKISFGDKNASIWSAIGLCNSGTGEKVLDLSGNDPLGMIQAQCALYAVSKMLNHVQLARFGFPFTITCNPS